MGETITASVSSITEVGTAVLTWFLEMATKIFNFVVQNPVALIYLVVGLILVAIGIYRRIVHS